MSAAERKLFTTEKEVYDSPFDLTFEEQFQVDEATLRERGYTSDFCGAWLGLWACIAREYGTALEAESTRMRARKGKQGESAEQILCKASRAYMAVISAACRADGLKSQLRRFKASAFYLEATRRNEYYDLKALPKETARRLQQNYGRYWREAWSYIHLVQRVTHLPFVEHKARAFKDNQRVKEPARYTDRLTDIMNGIIAEKNAMRGCRPERFSRAVIRRLERFRYECEHECKNPQTCTRPHTFYPEWRPGQAEAEGVGKQKGEGDNGGKHRTKVISFSKAKEKILAGVEIAKARAEAGYLSPAEAEDLITMLAPIVEIATRTCGAQSAIESVVPLADFDTPGPANTEADEPKFMPRTQNENCDFAEENCKTDELHADKFIRQEDATLDDFLSVFFPDPYEEINLRTFAPTGAPDDPRFSAKKWRTCREALCCDEELLAELQLFNRTRGLYFVVNSGGDEDKDITRFNAFFAEMDAGTFAEQHAKLDACPVPPTIRVETLKSVHAYWHASPGVAETEWREVQARLIQYLKSDRKIKNPSRVMRLPGFNHVSYNDGLLSYKPVRIVRFDSERRFTAEEMLAAFPAIPDHKPHNEYARKTIDALTSPFEAWKRELGQRIAAHRSARRNGRSKVDCQGICHNGKGNTGLFFDPSTNFIQCNSGCELSRVAAAFGLPSYSEV